MKLIALSLALLIAGPAAAADIGQASWYHLPGNRTANGEAYSGSGHSCAHRTHRFGTRLRVTDLRTGHSVVCRVNDRGPFVRGRIVDLNRGAARSLGIISRGVTRVSIVVVR